VSDTFDSRIVTPHTVKFLQACGRHVPYHLGGGAALAGFHLRHRLSADADVFLHDRSSHRELVRLLPDISIESNTPLVILRDAGTFVRARLDLPGRPIDLDVVFDQVQDIEDASLRVDGIVLESLVDLRVNKLTCLLSRSEPRDLVDLLFLDRAGFAPERDLALALKKDAGIDPGVLAWLLREFPLEPLPEMLVPFSVMELGAFRDELAERLRRLAVP